MDRNYTHSCRILFAPTTSLPPLALLAGFSAHSIQQAVNDLKNLYWPPSPPLPPKLSLPKRTFSHRIRDDSVPDSGYASAEDDDDGTESSVKEFDIHLENKTSDDVELLRSDPLERAFAIKWVTGFIARADGWIDSASSEMDLDTRQGILDNAAAILSFFSADEDDEIEITRTFTFPRGPNEPPVVVELNDAPLSDKDHTSVGLQSWGSSILLAERMCASAATYSFVHTNTKPLRILELGAGTGLLSIVAAKLLHDAQAEIVATDFHPDVLQNLRRNIATNIPESFSALHISVHHLDWELPRYDQPLNERYDIILAADVIYHPAHAKWIKACVERLLKRYSGVFWLIIPVRTTGRHEGMYCSIDDLFPLASSMSGDLGALATIEKEEIEKQKNVGRADEGGYKLYKIGWVL